MLRSKAVKITFYLLIGIMFMSFLLFISTYSFASKKSYTSTSTREEIAGIFEDMFSSSIEKSKILNVLELSISTELINDSLTTLSDENEEYIFDSEFWTLKGIKIDFRGEYVICDLYADFHSDFNYSLKIRAFFTFTEDSYSSSYIFKLRKIHIGSIVIPSYLVKSVLLSKEENSIGSIVRSAIESLPFGSYDQENIEFTIAQSEIVNSIKSGYLGDLLFEKNEQKKVTIASYVEMLLQFDLISLSINNGIILKLDYSNIINNPTTITGGDAKTYDEMKAYIKEEEADLVLEYLLGDTVNLDNKYLNILYQKAILSKVEKEDTSGDTYFSSLYSSTIERRADGVNLSFNFYIDDIYSTAVYYFTKDTSGLYHLDEVTIGKDQNEDANTYIIVQSTSELIGFLSALSSYGITINSGNQTADIDAFLDSIYVNKTNYNLNYPIIYKNTSTTLKNTLTTSSVYMSSELNLNYSTWSNIDWTSIDTIKTSFKELNLSSKEDFLTKLRDYYSDSDTLVYNDIRSILNIWEG